MTPRHLSERVYRVCHWNAASSSLLSWVTSLSLPRIYRSRAPLHTTGAVATMQSIIFAFCLLVTLTLAMQSDPFYLVLQSSNSTLNGRTLFACHEGAAIEGLCLEPRQDKANVPYSTFRFNYTKSTPNSGLLTWTLKGSDFKSKHDRASPAP